MDTFVTDVTIEAVESLQFQEPKHTWSVYVVNPPSYKEWTKIGQTKNVIEREKRYNDSNPLKDYKLDIIIKGLTQFEAFLIEQSVKTELATLFETRGEWIKCDPLIVKNIIHTNYCLITKRIKEIIEITNNDQLRSICDLQDDKYFAERRLFGNYLMCVGKTLMKYSYSTTAEIDGLSFDAFLCNLPQLIEENWSLQLPIKFQENELALHLPTFFTFWKKKHSKVEKGTFKEQSKHHSAVKDRNRIVRFDTPKRALVIDIAELSANLQQELGQTRKKYNM